MKRAVYLTRQAGIDLMELHSHLSEHDSPEKADRVLSRIEQAISVLADSSHRGAVPSELGSVGEREVRQIHFKPYRIVYEVLPDRAVILLVADGRRDLQSLLLRRLLSR